MHLCIGFVDTQVTMVVGNPLPPARTTGISFSGISGFINSANKFRSSGFCSSSPRICSSYTWICRLYTWFETTLWIVLILCQQSWSTGLHLKQD